MLSGIFFRVVLSLKSKCFPLSDIKYIVAFKAVTFSWVGFTLKNLSKIGGIFFGRDPFTVKPHLPVGSKGPPIVYFDLGYFI